MYNSTKFLGLIMDKELTGNNIIIKLVETKIKISKILGLLHVVRVRCYISLRTLKTVYDALIYPHCHMTYCAILWASTYATSFPGSLILPPRVSEERPWSGLVTC